MAKTIKVVRKKDPKKKNQSDPLAKQKLIWKIGHVFTLVFGLVFSITYFYHALTSSNIVPGSVVPKS